MDHYEFITKTDNKSLFNQIKYLVSCAQESYHKDLTTRREHLRELLEGDENVYEKELVTKIKSRVDESIRERQRSLLAMKVERTKENERFVASKKIHQNMQNCIEIREELRKKDYRETQLCQLEQMDDKLRAIASEKKDDEFWLNVQKRLADDYDRKQENEKKLKKNLQCNQCNILDRQVAQNKNRVKMDREYAVAQKIALQQALKASNKAQAEKAHAAKLARKEDVKQSLTTICEQRDALQREDEAFEEIFHMETMRQVREEMDQAKYKNAGVREAVLDYLTYVKKFKAFSNDQEQKCDAMYEDLGKHFYCYKSLPKKAVILRKRVTAESTHKVLLNQICEEHSRKAKEEAYQKEHKIIENRFARLQIRDKIKEREMIKTGLDKQLEVLSKIREEKQKHFQQEMNRAEEDNIYCQKLLDRHKNDGCDYLTPHPNWKLLACYKHDGRGDCK